MGEISLDKLGNAIIIKTVLVSQVIVAVQEFLHQVWLFSLRDFVARVLYEKRTRQCSVDSEGVIYTPLSVIEGDKVSFLM